MHLLISDANILIDMIEADLVRVMFQLPYRFGVPDILYAEELEERHSDLLGFGLQTHELSSESMLKAFELVHRYAGPSRQDCFALALAIQENCSLLTGDKALRAAAEKESVQFKGTIWLIEELVKHQIITVDGAHCAYLKMKDAGSRLPWNVAFDRLKHLAVGN